MADELPTLTLEDLPLEVRRTLTHSNPLVLDYAARKGAQYGLPDGFMPAIITAGEQSASTGKMSVSPKGALGIAQLMPGTSKALGVEDPTDPMQGIDGGARYAASIGTSLGTKDPLLIAAGYNAGPNRDSLRAGRVPAIPETQAYVKRIGDFLAARVPAANAATVDSAPSQKDGMLPSFGDLPPALQAAIRKNRPEADPTTGGGTLQIGPFDTGIKTSQGIDRALSGGGKFFSEMGSGLGQLMTDAVVNPTSRALSGKDLIDSEAQMKQEAERRGRDAPLMDTGAGMAGYAGTAIATSALPGSWAAKGAAPMLAGLKALGVSSPALSVALPSMVSGATLATAQPVAAPGERSKNMAEAATISGALSTLGGAVKYATPWAKKIQEFLGQEVNVPGWRPSWAAQAAPTARKAVETAMEEGVPVYGSQLKAPGSSLPKSRADEQADALTRAVTRSFGQEGDDFAQALGQAKTRFSGSPGQPGEYERLLGNRVIPLPASHMNDLNAIAQYNTALSPRFAPNAGLQDAVDRARAAATQQGHLTGHDYQSAMQGYKQAIDSLFPHGAAAAPNAAYAANGYRMLMDSLTKHVKTALPDPIDLKAFETLNKQYRNMSTTAPLVPKDLAEPLSSKQFAALMARQDPNAFRYGKGDTTLSDLAKYANTYMSPKPSKGLWAGAKDFAGKAAPFAAASTAEAALIGSQLHKDSSPEESVLKKYGPTGALALATLGLLSAGRRAGNPKLTPADLNAPQGALAEWYRRMSPSVGAGLTANTLSNED